MAKSFYVGIDESNHGRYPEIFVAVHSDNFFDAKGIEKDVELVKIRNDARSVFELLSGRDFKYVVISKDYEHIFGRENAEQKKKVVACAELIKAFSQDSNLEGILIDGDLRRIELESIRKILFPYQPKILRGIRYGDQKVPLVNLADAVANKIHRYFKCRRKGRDELQKRLLAHLVSPKFENYHDFLVD